MSKVLSQQIREKEERKRAETFNNKSIPDIAGNMGYPQIKDISLSEQKQNSLSLYKTHHRIWATQINERKINEEHRRREEEKLRVRFEEESRAFKEKVEAARIEKVQNSKYYANVWDLQGKLAKINKREESNINGVFLTDGSDTYAKSTSPISHWKRTLEQTQKYK